MKIVFVGTRGIPANYGGFETCVDEIATRLAAKHQVFVYARRSQYEHKVQWYKNVNIIYLPALKSRSLETLTHTFLSTLHALVFHWDSIYMVFNVATSPALLLPWIFRRRLAINTDGLEWKRDKWGYLGRLYYQFAEWLSTKLVRNLVTDCRGMHDYYQNRWGKKSIIIEYGAYRESSVNQDILKQFNVQPNKYFLQITRFEPENSPLLTVDAFKLFKKKIQSPMKLLIVGDVTYPSHYSKKVKSFKSNDVILPGFIFDRSVLRELRSNCFAYIHGNQVGGTNPALLEAMGACAFIIARDVGFNREVLEHGGVYYECIAVDLSEKMVWFWLNQHLKAVATASSQKKIKDYYNWDRITTEYEKLFISMD